MAKRLYDESVKPYIKDIQTMAEKGLTKEQIAKTIKIDVKTLRKYIEEEEELRKAISAGREVAIKDIESAMLNSAIGGKVLVKKGMKVKTCEYDDHGKKIREIEEVVPYDEEVYVKPDITAGIFLLKNWAKDRYSSDPQMLELKKQEQEMKKKMLELDDDEEYDIFN